MRKILGFLLALCALPALGQTSAVTATITDGDGQAWATLNGFNATWSAQLVSSSGVLIPQGQAVRIDNGASVTVTAQGTMDSSGTFSTTIVSSNNIRPSGTRWKFQVCPAVTSAQCNVVTLPINASGTYSSQLSAGAVAPRIGGGIGNYAYTDTEVAAIPNNSYLNITGTAALRCYVTSWGTCGGSSGPFQSLTTNGSSGAATLIAGVLNVPQYSGGGTPGGSTLQGQFNLSGAFAGTSALTFLADGTISQVANVRHLSASSELGAQVTAAATSLGATGGLIVFPNSTSLTWTTATSQLAPNISFIGYGTRATNITCSVAGNCLNIHEPVDWASTSISIGSEISGFTMIGSAATASNQVLISGEGLNGFTIHDVALNGLDGTHEPTCMEWHNTTTGAVFTERNITYNFQFGQQCLTSVLFAQDGGDANTSFGYNQFEFSVAPTGPNYGIVFNGGGVLYGGSLTILGNYVGTGGGILQFNNGSSTGSPGGAAGTPVEHLFISVENNSGDSTAHIISATGTNDLEFSGDVFNGCAGGCAFTTPFSIGGSAKFNLSGPLGAQSSLSSGPVATDTYSNTGGPATVRRQLCPNLTGSCLFYTGHDGSPGNQAILGFNYVGNNNSGSRGFVGTLSGGGFDSALLWDPTGNIYIPAGILTLGGPSYNPNANIVTFTGDYAFGTNFALKNTSAGGLEWDEISSGSSSGIAGVWALSNTTTWPFMVFDNNSVAPQIETVSNAGFCWSTTTTGGIGNANVNNCLSSSGGIISADTTAVGNGLATFKAANLVGNHQTKTNCSSSASPAVCASASAGSVALPTNAVSSSIIVNTTAVTANSQIFAFADDTLGTKLGVTCNSTVATLVGGLTISARTAGTSFTVANNVAVVTNPLCISYLVIN